MHGDQGENQTQGGRGPRSLGLPQKAEDNLPGPKSTLEFMLKSETGCSMVSRESTTGTRATLIAKSPSPTPQEELQSSPEAVNKLLEMQDVTLVFECLARSLRFHPETSFVGLNDERKP